MMKKVRMGSDEEPLAKNQNGSPGMKEKRKERAELWGREEQEINQLPDRGRR